MFTRLNTILLPDTTSLVLLLKLSQQIFSGKEELFHIDNKNYFAHLTLYPPEFPNANISQVFSTVENISQTQLPVKLKFESLLNDQGYLGMEFIQDEPIKKLHKLVLEKLNPLRQDRIRDKYVSEINQGKYSPEQIDYIKSFGYPWVLTAFHPHLTLGRFNGQTSKPNQKLFPSTINFTALAVSEMGSHGTCTKILNMYKLSSH